MAKTWCSECGERQFVASDTAEVTCANNHNGAGSVDQTEAVALGYDITRRLRRVISPPRAEIHRRPTIGKRSKEDRELSDATVTPKWLADFFYETLGPFDLDPCSNPRSHIVSHWAFSLEKHLDGLKLPWHGSVFMNNPYSAPMEWMLKARHELEAQRCNELVVLCKLDPSTRWWPIITAGWPDLWLFNDRIDFDEHPELIERRRCEVAEGRRNGRKDGKSSNNFCSVIIHHRFDDYSALKLEPYATLWRRS